jgi:hypothetical protein
MEMLLNEAMTVAGQALIGWMTIAATGSAVLLTICWAAAGVAQITRSATQAGR